ncbi:UDP-glucose 4-epimerase GalE [Thiohalocapsa halophila]|uniref:UDP-glucose 4-epimerase n=1 Tax=Thiohalocapsa halophila TaxID=69359 RepID=A0ABS1CN16_9GAMM|nr:UDP-glucose 4-epimerase GalE [Thiohalocapsa halophila]MBK1633337.1 UDP-glucose 4-epimerase GalE [Thiohalocapsa halophila]
MRSLSAKNILVTGGAGYIGSHTCKALHRAGYRPVVCDNLLHGHRWAVRWGPLEQGNIADRQWLDDVLLRYQPIAAMHFAAYAYVGESVSEPAKYYRNNVAGTLTLLEALRDHGVERCVFSSTCATYGDPETVPIPDDAVQQPINPYGASKWMMERMLADFDRAYGLRSIALRYFNAAGADPDGEIGEWHDPETHLIPLAIAAAMGSGKELSIYGTDYDTPDGTAVRDYVHVADLAAAHVRALDRLLAGSGSGAMNLGTGRGRSVREVIDAVQRVGGRRVPVEEAPRRPGDPPVLVADAALAQRQLDWTPAYSGLDQIVETAWRWHESRTGGGAAEQVIDSRGVAGTKP